MRAVASLVLFLALLAVTPGPVVVDYAGSLVTPMEGAVATRLLADEGLTFQGEAKGSKALANLIRDGVRTPDVFVSADESLVRMLQVRGLVESATVFGGAELGIGYTAKSRERAALDAARANPQALIGVLQTPGIRIARTDPKLDPKGERTVRAMGVFAGNRSTAILGDPENPQQIFPEEDLLVRLESGDADVGFVYSTEAKARRLFFIPLPGRASLSDEITYTLAVMRNAPHPDAARAFAAFITTGAGKSILEDAGVRYFEKLKPL